MDTLAPKLFKSMIKQLITDSGSLCFSILPSALCWFPSCSHYCYPCFQGSHADLLCQRRREMWSPHLSLCLLYQWGKIFPDFQKYLHQVRTGSYFSPMPFNSLEFYFVWYKFFYIWFLFFKTPFSQQFSVHSKIGLKVVSIYRLPPHMHSSPVINIPHESSTMKKLMNPHWCIFISQSQ